MVPVVMEVAAGGAGRATVRLTSAVADAARVALLGVATTLRDDVTGGGRLHRDAYAEDRFAQLSYEMGAGSALDESRAADLTDTIEVLHGIAVGPAADAPATVRHRVVIDPVRVGQVTVSVDVLRTIARATNVGRQVVRGQDEDDWTFQLLSLLHAMAVEALMAGRQGGS